MIGDKKLKDIKASIRDAFAKKGMDVQAWLDEQMAKLRRHRQVEQGVVESLILIRDGLRTDHAARKRLTTRKKRTKKRTMKTR